MNVLFSSYSKCQKKWIELLFLSSSCSSCNDSCCRHIVKFLLSMISLNIIICIKMVKVITIYISWHIWQLIIEKDCFVFWISTLYSLFNFFSIIPFRMSMHKRYISSNIFVYVSSCLYSLKHNMFVDFVGSIFKYHTVRWTMRVDEQQQLILTFSFSLILYFFVSVFFFSNLS